MMLDKINIDEDLIKLGSMDLAAVIIIGFHRTPLQ